MPREFKVYIYIYISKLFPFISQTLGWILFCNVLACYQEEVPAFLTQWIYSSLKYQLLGIYQEGAIYDSCSHGDSGSCDLSYRQKQTVLCFTCCPVFLCSRIILRLSENLGHLIHTTRSSSDPPIMPDLPKSFIHPDLQQQRPSYILVNFKGW